MSKKIKYLYRAFISVFFNPKMLLLKIRATPYYLSNVLKYSISNKSTKFKIDFLKLYFYTTDRFSESGNINHHYFHQDLWMARKIFNNGTKLHYDVGSRIDGFVAHLLTFCEVNYVDIRPLNSNVDNLTFIQGSILELPFETNSINSLSCLHVIEHIGLGRYGDDIDALGYEKSAAELIRVLSPGGKLYFSTPVGKECLHFDAHRVFHHETIMSIFSELELLEFSFIDDNSDRVLNDVPHNIISNSEYGCGLFIFQKK